MSARIFAIINAVGCVALTAAILTQWFLGTVVERELRDEKIKAIEEHNLRVDVEKRAAGLEADVNGLKASIESIRTDAEEKTRSLTEQANQAEQLHTGLTHAQDQLKVMDEAIKARDEAIKSRDEAIKGRDGKLKEMGEALAATRKRLDEAIGKLKQAGAKP